MRAIKAELEPDKGEVLPGWMQSSNGEMPSVPGLPLDNDRELPGLMTEELSESQDALVRCLNRTKLGRPLVQWQDPEIYQSGIIERCKREVLQSGCADGPEGVNLPARAIQDAVSIAVSSRQLAAINNMYRTYGGQYARDLTDLRTNAVMPARISIPPSVLKGGMNISANNRVVVELKGTAEAVCKALNMLHGRQWVSVPGSLPAGATAGCYSFKKGFRFEYQGDF